MGSGNKVEDRMGLDRGRRCVGSPCNRQKQVGDCSVSYSVAVSSQG